MENGKIHWKVIDIDNLVKAYLLLVEKILRPRAAEDVHWNTEGYQIASTEEVVCILPKLGLWPADMTGYVDQKLGYEVEELYGISLWGK